MKNKRFIVIKFYYYVISSDISDYDDTDISNDGVFVNLLFS